MLVTPDELFGVMANYMTKEAWSPTDQFRVLFFAVPKQEVAEYIEAVQQAPEENSTYDPDVEAAPGESQPDSNG